jgi:hypothetical protein
MDSQVDLCAQPPSTAARVSEAKLGLVNQLVTQFLQRRIVRQLIRDGQIDVIHQPIPVAPRFPSAMFGLGVPVVIGPMNGGMEYPPALRHTESRITRTAPRRVRKTLFGRAIARERVYDLDR